MCREPLQGLHECSPFLCLLVLDRWIGAHRDNVALETPSERRVGHLLMLYMLLFVRVCKEGKASAVQDQAAKHS